MIVVSHDFFNVQSIFVNGKTTSFDLKLNVGAIVYELALKHPDTIIIWCHDKVKTHLNLEYIQSVFTHDRLLFSYNPLGNFFSNSIGYVEDNPFINVNKEVQYPTWQMSSYVGAIQSKSILLIKQDFWKIKSFDFCLNSIAKCYQSLGLFCYSDPNILKNNNITVQNKSSRKELFVFVAQHYKKVWLFLLFFNSVIFEKKFPLSSFLFALLYKKINVNLESLKFEDNSNYIDVKNETIDVIIPTIGRKTYLYNVLCDLKKQTHLPKNVIIVEQNPLKGSESELSYIKDEVWPFEIKHIFTHQTGACQARNKALKEINSKWCFFADDDIVLAEKFLKEAIDNTTKLNVEASIFSCLLPNVENSHLIISQSTIFGSGCSIVLSQKLRGLTFNEVLEFGFGEDTEFGLQLRNIGVDIIYFPKPEIIHLKAPMGGFRTKHIQPWELENIQPKPSPTVLYFRKKYYSVEQLNGYKTILFLKFYKSQQIKNPYSYFKEMQKRWDVSCKWANKLLNENEV